MKSITKLLGSLTSSEVQDQFHIRLEPQGDGHTLVFVSHAALEEVAVDGGNQASTFTWQPAQPNLDLEAEMLERIALACEPSGDQALATDQHQGNPGAGKPLKEDKTAAQVKKENDARKGFDDKNRIDVLNLDQRFDLAWRQVSLALDRGSFTIDDRDRSQGLVFIRYLDPDYVQSVKDKRSFWARTFSSDPKVDAQQFRLVIKSDGDHSHVTVQSDKGVDLHDLTASHILQRLNDQLK